MAEEKEESYKKRKNYETEQNFKNFFQTNKEIDDDIADDIKDENINNAFGFGDNKGENGNDKEFKRIRRFGGKNVIEFLWENHTLVVNKEYRENDNNKNKKIIVGIGINPKKVEGGKSSLCPRSNTSKRD